MERIISNLTRCCHFAGHRYGSLGDSPIHYLFQSVDMAELSALYSIADAALITSIRYQLFFIVIYFVLSLSYLLF